MNTRRNLVCSALLVSAGLLIATTTMGGERTPLAGGGNELEVDNTGACGGAGQPFCEIADAIAVAMPGDTIEVEGGGPAYMPIVIPAALTNLTIEADDDDDDPIIDGGGGVAVTVNATGFEIEGFEIRNATEGVIFNASGGEVDDCEIHDCTNIGVFIAAGVNNCDIEDNEFFACGAIPGALLGAAIVIQGMGHNVEDNDIHDNPGACAVGIGVQDGNSNDICDNEIDDSGFDGILIAGISANNDIEGNEVEDSGGAGYSTNNATCMNNCFEENDAEENMLDGFLEFAGTANQFEENESSENTFSGFFYGGTMSQYDENEAEENMMDGFTGGAGSMNNTIEDSESEDNTGFGINDLNGAATTNMYDDNDCDDNGAGDSSPPDLCD